MKYQPKLLRTLLYIPGNKEDWIIKSPKYSSDALILDLEDSVPIDEKPVAREIISRLIGELSAQGETIFVRVNSISSRMTELDLSKIVQEGLYAISLPMVEGPKDIEILDKLLSIEEENKGLPVGSILIDPGLETAYALRSAYDVAKVSRRVAHMGAGGGRGGDIARAVGYKWTPEGLETLFLRSKVLLDSKAAGISFPVTGLWQDIEDIDGLKRFAIQSREIGYTGMAVIHPSHVPVVNEIFSPSQDEIKECQGLIKAMDEVRNSGGAAVSYLGGMVDIAHEKTAIETLKLARELGLVLED
tara:strand:- start:744 stop:1649 length:906 start_codon:yes stop_codon:yes gene_type:complete